MPNMSYIKFIFNEQPTVNKLLANISWESTYIDGDTSVLDIKKTFDKIRVENSYQNTYDIDLDFQNNYRDPNANIALKMGVWNFNNIVTPIPSGGTYKQQKRFIDKYNSVCLINDNTTKNILYLSNIDVRQRLSQF
jgi:hypothetical protein